MKKTLITLITLLVAVLAVSSCRKEGVREESSTQPDGGIIKSFSVQIKDACIDAEITRASVNVSDGKVRWEEGDQIKVSNGTASAVFTYDADSQTFVSESGIAATGIYSAVYPASVVTSVSGLTFNVSLPSTQEYDANSVKNAPMSAYSTTNSLSFKNVCAILKLQLNGDQDISSIVFTANGKSVAGAAAINPEDASLTMSTQGLDVLTLNTSSVHLGTATPFYIVVPAQLYSDGFSIKANTTVSGLAFYKSTTRAINLSAGHISAMKAFDATLFSGGLGTQENPYVIAKPEDLVNLAKYINETSESNNKFKFSHYSQTSDIDMSGINSFRPIGCAATLDFCGHYNGNNHKIINLSYHNTVEGGTASLFGHCGAGTELSNIMLENVTLENDYYYSGAVAGNLYAGTMKGCSACGTIFTAGAFTSGMVSYTGGLCGRMEDSGISDCTFSGRVSATYNHIGGIVGDSDGKCRISGCKLEKGTLVGGDSHVGGIISTSNGVDTQISGCICAGDVHAIQGSAGGIVASFYYGTIKNCVQSSASKVVCGAYNVGGIAGQANANVKGVTDAAIYIDNCAVYGAVSGQYQVGGITGYSYGNNAAQKVVISNCACIGSEITATGIDLYNYSPAAGICGYQQGPALLATVNCFSRPALINANNTSSIGGIAAILGYDNNAANKLTNCYSAASAATLQCGGQPVASVWTCSWYGSVVGHASAAVPVTNCHYLTGIQITPEGGSQVVSGCNAYTEAQMTDGTMLTELNSGKSKVTEATPSSWVAGSDSYPTLSGLPQDPYPGTKKSIRVSIIGDGISTFNGWIPSGYKTYYPESDCDITSAALTYWYKLIYNYMRDAEFDTNLSYSNSTVTYNTYYGKEDQYKDLKDKDFCSRFIDYGGMGRPDVIIINGGTNDQGHNAGEYLISTTAMLSDVDVTASAMSSLFTTADACKTYSASTELPCLTFAEAYVKLVRMMKLKYPSARVVCIIPEWVKYKGIRSVIKLVAQHYGAKYVVMPIQDNVNIPKYNGCHPNAAGMEYMAGFIYNYKCEGVKVGPWMEGE